MAEIYAVKEVWDPKVQLCWWHLRKAVRERLKNTKLSTTPYKPTQANTEFPFIDITFTPLGRADAIETKGLIDSDDEELPSNTRSSPIPSPPRQFLLNSETSKAYGLTQTGVAFTADTQ